MENFFFEDMDRFNSFIRKIFEFNFFLLINCKLRGSNGEE